MLDNGTAAYIQRYQDRINAITNPQNQSSVTSQYGPGQPDNATQGYSLNNPYATGNRVYNGSAPSPQVGPGSVDPAGYATRDNMAAAKNNALAQRLGAM